jgi:hypothetical protein
LVADRPLPRDPPERTECVLGAIRGAGAGHLAVPRRSFDRRYGLQPGIRHHIAAQQQQHRFFKGEAQRRQKVAVEKRIAPARLGHHRHARFAKRLDVAIDRALAYRKRLGKIFGPALATRLQL